jgi:DNA-binding CsgD family transcriptional regulator
MLKPEAKVEDLDQREFNVAYLKAKGLRRKQIAIANHISANTVDNELRRVRYKLGTINPCYLRILFEREGGWL